MRDQPGVPRTHKPSTNALQFIGPGLDRAPNQQTTSRATRTQTITLDQHADVQVQTDNGTIQVIEFHPYQDQVYVWQGERLLTALHRRGLSDWLGDPISRRPITAGRLTLAFSTATGFTLTVPGISAAPIAPATITRLRHRLRP